MPNDSITYQNSGYFSTLIVDYLDEKPNIKQLYNRFPKIENFKFQIEEKKANFPEENRRVLVSELEKQYAGFEITEVTSNNIKLINNTNTFTITTGHQLNLFTGPVYFLYKIISVINLCKTLKTKYPKYNFVPVYWMATEDHDFEEINYFNIKGKKVKWNKESTGPVGRISTEGLQEVFEQFSLEIGLGENANNLRKWFEQSYLKHSNLANATRFLVNELFKKEGLIIIDGDSIELKKLFVPFLKSELLEQQSYKKVSETNNFLKDYWVQVNPREINLFYIENNLRERIVFENKTYKINNTNIEFSENELLAELEKHPEKFSPNAILRPLYQEVILPNLCYVGGAGEIAYWLQLKTNFEAKNITFPMLLLRNSAIIITKKQFEKKEKLNLKWSDLFMQQQALLNKKTEEFSQFTIDFTDQKEHLKKQFEKLYEIANLTDASFLGAVKAQEVKQKNGLNNLEKRLLKAEKRVYAEKLQSIVLLQKEIFPNGSLQERTANFSEFYLEFGENLLIQLIEKINPLTNKITIEKLV